MLVVFQGPRGRGGPPMRGGRGGNMRGGRGGGGGNMRGGRGGSGGRGGRGGRGGMGDKGGPRGGKRKMGTDHSQGPMKRRNVDQNQWGAQPIAQQPLESSGYEAQWYQDSYGGQQW